MGSQTLEATFVILGGGIAGVSCAESLEILKENETTILVSASPLIKTVSNVLPLSRYCTQFEVSEISGTDLSKKYGSVTVVNDLVESIESEEHCIKTFKGFTIKYKKLCICSGASPKVVWKNKNVVGIRDVESVEYFQKLLSNCRRVVVVGNGGIATELVHELKSIEIIWAIKDSHISATFIDPGAAKFFQSRLESKEEETEGPIKRQVYRVSGGEGWAKGASLGPDWHSTAQFEGALGQRSLKIEYSCEVVNIISYEEPKEGWHTFVELSNGATYGCDLVVSATGVVPNTGFIDNTLIKLEPDGGISVNDKMETSIKDIYAAGDVCSASWPPAQHWLRMRLWTQARQMGSYAGRVMYHSLNNQEIYQDFCFEIFSHVTKFFGLKVVLLGLFNGQKLNNEYDILLRITKNQEYIKLILKNGKLQGAVLIGETDLEETFENLLLNQQDLTAFGEDLLNPNVDIEDYFD